MMGYNDATQLPIWQYLHGTGAPNYILHDNFFQGGFGGSFANHQVLVSGQLPLYDRADKSGTYRTLEGRGWRTGGLLHRAQHW